MARAFLDVILQRVMGIIFPGRTYDEALVIASYERLDIRRKKICIKTLRKIIRQGPLKEHVLQTIYHYRIYHYTSVEQSVLRTASSQVQSPRLISKYRSLNGSTFVYLSIIIFIYEVNSFFITF